MRIPTFIAMSSDVEDAFTFSTREAAKSHAVDIRDRNRNHASGEAPKLMRVKKHDGCFILTDGVDFWTVN